MSMRLFINASASEIPLASESAHCMITSPPYWSLRKYAGEQTRQWPAVTYVPMSGLPAIEVHAWEGALGLEPTPEMHVAHIVLVMREVYRVLRDDGVAWVNYGDCYSAGGWECVRRNQVGSGSMAPDERKSGKVPGIGQGNLMLIPHRVALALQADRWIIRNDCVWHKKNPMPESCAGTRWEREREKKSRSGHAKEHNIKGGHKKMLEDASVHQGIGPHWLADYEYGPDLVLRQGSWRHTRAHEYIFMLTKQMGYWSDQEAVREAHSPKSFTVHTTPRKGDDGSKGDRFNKWLSEEGRGRKLNPSGRNPRSVFSLATEPYKHAHYATYPRSLIAPLMLATCPRRCCPECGKGWAAVVERGYEQTRRRGDWTESVEGDHGRSSAFTAHGVAKVVNKTLGYKPTCECGHEEHVPGVVLDPFVGSGTTLQVAKEIGVHGIGLDISYEYLRDQALLRVENITPRDALDGLPMFEGVDTVSRETEEPDGNQ